MADFLHSKATFPGDAYLSVGYDVLGDESLCVNVLLRCNV